MDPSDVTLISIIVCLVAPLRFSRQTPSTNASILLRQPTFVIDRPKDLKQPIYIHNYSVSFNDSLLSKPFGSYFDQPCEMLIDVTNISYYTIRGREKCADLRHSNSLSKAVKLFSRYNDEASAP